MKKPTRKNQNLQNESPQKSLQIVQADNKILSKNQKSFNQLTKRIETLQNKIKSESVKLDKILIVYSDKIPKLEKNLADKQLSLAKKLGESTEYIKYGKRQLESIKTVILSYCDEAFSTIIPDEETEAFYDKWTQTSYKEELEMQTQDMKENLATQMKLFMGIDIDLSEFDNSPEGFYRMQEKLREEFEKVKQQRDESSFTKKKTKKQIEREEKEKEEETSKLKSIRNIYLSLAKTLHPDTETDPEEKLLKEELMKKVTAAYNEKDLAALLKLEMEWVIAERNHLDKLSDDKLKLYITALKEQVAQLEMELYSLPKHPRYAGIYGFSHLPEDLALKDIDHTVRSYKTELKKLDNILQSISQPDPKKDIMQFVNDKIKSFNRRPSIDDLFAFGF